MSSGLNIVIVDDNKFYSKGFSLVLNRLFDINMIIELNSGVEFLQLITTTSPDLVFMDIQMPKMDGITATKKAIKQNHNLKIIALTMYLNSQFLSDMLKAGSKGFLLKDFNENELITTVNEVLNGEIHYPSNVIKNIDHQNIKL